MLAAWLAALSAAAPAPLARLEDAGTRRAGLTVELLRTGADGTGAEAAEALLRQEGLVAWDPTHTVARSDPGARLGYRALWSGDGRNVVIYYSDRAPGRLCRLRAAGGGLSPERYRAIRWCGSRLGLAMPATPPPPVR